MRDLSFVIPIRIDSADRLENCRTILRFLGLHFRESEIQLVEQDRITQTESLRAEFPQVVWHFEFNDAHFSRGRAINTGLLRSSRRIVCAYDTDILIEPDALRRSVKLIRSGGWRIVIPFNLIFIEVSGTRRQQIIRDLDISGVSRVARLADVPVHPEVASRVLSGAIMMCDRIPVIMEGGYNSKMVSYGWEDIEFFKRFEKLGYYSYMLNEFNLVHLDHRRGPDSRVNEKYEINKSEFNRVLRMSAGELKYYVDEELQIDPNIDVGARNRWRKGRAFRNWLTLRRAMHIINKAATIWRINGTRGLLNKVREVANPA